MTMNTMYAKPEPARGKHWSGLTNTETSLGLFAELNTVGRHQYGNTAKIHFHPILVG
jgi:hypothetical protein